MKKWVSINQHIDIPDVNCYVLFFFSNKLNFAKFCYNSNSLLSSEVVTINQFPNQLGKTFIIKDKRIKPCEGRRQAGRYESDKEIYTVGLLLSLRYQVHKEYVPYPYDVFVRFQFPVKNTKPVNFKPSYYYFFFKFWS